MSLSREIVLHIKPQLFVFIPCNYCVYIINISWSTDNEPFLAVPKEKTQIILSPQTSNFQLAALYLIFFKHESLDLLVML